MLLPEEIEYAVLEYPVYSEAYKIGSVPKRVEVRDRRLIEELLSINGPDDYTGLEEIINVMFSGRTTAGPFQFRRWIHRDWPVSETLKEHMKQLD